MRIAFLTNSLLALHSAAVLREASVLTGIAAYAGNTLLCEQIQAFAGIPHGFVRRDHLEADLNAWVDAAAPDLVVVQTFPFRIPAACLGRLPGGFINLHPGPLPAYRGPDPVFRVIQAGEGLTGITMHHMEADFDTGPVIHFEPVLVGPFDTYGTVHTALALAAGKAIQVLLAYESAGQPPPSLVQDPRMAAFQGKPSVQDLVIDWPQASASTVDALVRACNPNQNGAITFFRGVLVRLLEVQPFTPEFAPRLSPGTVIAADASRGLQVLCSDGQALRVEVLHVDEGYYSGRRFCQVFEVLIGEKFTMPG